MGDRGGVNAAPRLAHYDPHRPGPFRGRWGSPALRCTPFRRHSRKEASRREPVVQAWMALGSRPDRIRHDPGRSWLLLEWEQLSEATSPAVSRVDAGRFRQRTPWFAGTTQAVPGDDAGRPGRRRRPSRGTTNAVRGHDTGRSRRRHTVSRRPPTPFRATEPVVPGDGAERSHRRRKAFTGTPRAVPADASDRSWPQLAQSPATTPVVSRDGPHRLPQRGPSSIERAAPSRFMPRLERPFPRPHRRLGEEPRRRGLGRAGDRRRGCPDGSPSRRKGSRPPRISRPASRN